MSWWSQVSETAFQGLQITLVGMLLVFFTLGLIILALVLLTRLPGLRAEQKEKPERPSSPKPIQTVTARPPDADQDLAQVAAIALALARSQRRVGVRPRPQPAKSAWKSYGRAHQLGL